jgi:ActR/RegA family two-component response regulator
MARYPESGCSHGDSRRLIAFVASSVSSDTLDRLLDAGGYDVMLIDSMNDAYTQIKEVMPHLVIVCMQPEEEPLGCQVLSMLGIDRETSHIPVLTHLIEPDREPVADASLEAARFAPRVASLPMN